MRRLLAIRDARRYLIGQTFSMFGDSALWLAMGIWVRTLTGSNGAAGLVYFFFTAPALLAPLSGLLVDRVRRRPLLIATNACAGLAVLPLLLVHSAGQVWLIYLVMALYGLSYSVLGSAQSALLRVMVPDALLPDANGALSTIQESLRLIGPLAGAGLFVAIGAHAVVVVDAATFVVPVLSLLTLRVVEPDPAPRQRHWGKEMTAGVRFVFGCPPLRRLVGACACVLAVLGFGEAVIYAVVGIGLHRTPAYVGVLVAIQGVGAVVAGPTAAPLLRRIGEIRLVGIAMLISAAGTVLEMSSTLPVVATGVVLFGFSLPWLVVGFVTFIQRLTPTDLQGRVYSAADTLVTTPQTLSIAAGAVLVGITGYRLLLGAMAVVTALTATYLLCRRDPGAAPEPDPTDTRTRESVA